MHEENRKPLVSVIIVNWNGKDIIEACLQSIPVETRGRKIETIVVDNGSIDGSVERMEAGFPHVKLIKNISNLGFAAANNQAMALASGELFILLNSDAILEFEAIDHLVECLIKNPQIGILGPLLHNEDASIQPSFGCFASLWTEIWFQLFFYKIFPSCFPYGRRIHRWMTRKYQRQNDVDWVTGACLAVRRSVVEKVGGMMESSFMYGEDMEWCYRVRQAGYRVTFQPAAQVIHRLGYSSHRNYSSWIERYTTGQLQFVQNYRSGWSGRMAGLAVCLGSLLRIGAWYGISLVKPEKAVEARQRIAGYKKAFLLGRKVLFGYRFVENK